MKQQHLRFAAAILIGVSGTVHIAQLWYSPLSEETMLRALFGAVYLFICIGLLGLSRTSLILAAAIPIASAVLLSRFNTDGSIASGVALLQLTIDVIAAGFCGWVLYLIRHRPRA